MAEKTLTETLVDHVLAVAYDELPQAAIDMAKHVALDGLAVMLAGSTEPLGVGRISIEYVKEMGGAPQASVVAGGFKTSMLNAAYANGTMAHALDWDNTWYPLNHPTSPTLPAILALGEFHGSGGRKIIEAIVAAFEVQGRVRLAATGMADGQRFHKPGTTGMFGAVTAAVKMLDLDREQALMAFGIAGSRACSLSINTGSMTKSSHSGHAARMGLECGILAKKGWTAHPDVFGPGGFFDTFLHGDAEPAALVRGFADPLRMVRPGVGFKKHPSNYFTHRPIDAALALREQPGFDPSAIARVDIRFPRFDYVNRPQPKTGLDGKFSVQYATAIALLDGEITIDSFDDKRRFAPDAVDLLARTTLHFDDAIPKDFDRMHCVVTVTMRDGRVLEQKIERLTGWVGHPLTAEQRMKKFDACARRVLAADQAARVVELVNGLERADDVRAIMDIVRT
jgi:2-methylcitrate dehydratase PrpD